MDEDRMTREICLGLSRLVKEGDGPWTLDYGPLSVNLTWPPRIALCGGSGRWWWGFGACEVVSAPASARR